MRSRVAVATLAGLALLVAALVPCASRIQAVASPAAERVAGDVVRFATMAASSGRAHRTGWTASVPGRQWVQVRWSRPVELAVVRVGAAGVVGRTVTAGVLVFSDGSRVIAGGLEPRGGAPTTVAFTPRAVTWVRFVAEATEGGASARTGRLSAWTAGTLPPDPSTPARSFRVRPPLASSCTRTRGGATAALVLRCPSNGASVGGVAHLVVSGPAGAALRVIAQRPGSTALMTVLRARVPAGGRARLAIPMSRLAHGPTAVRIQSPALTPLHVQLENRTGIAVSAAPPQAGRGMTLVHDEEFNGPISLTRTGAGARYASGKPNSYGIDDFGDAIFSQPAASDQNIGTSGGVLRIRTRGLRAEERDPAGYSRRAVGGLISSAHLGGSGFSAQYGSFEARMLVPAGRGTWPAFWLLSTGSLSRGGSTGEVDAAELYGRDTSGVCQTVHSWIGGKDIGQRAFCERLVPRGDAALAWHTFGARVTPSGTVFTIDGRITGRTHAVIGADEPMGFLLDLALGGGWPVDLTSTGSQATLYVDYVRVWV